MIDNNETVTVKLSGKTFKALDGTLSKNWVKIRSSLQLGSSQGITWDNVIYWLIMNNKEDDIQK